MRNRNLTIGASAALVFASFVPTLPSFGANFTSTPSVQSGMSSSATGTFLAVDSGSAQIKDFYVEVVWSHSDPSTTSPQILNEGQNASQGSGNIVNFQSRVIACETSVTSSISYPLFGYGNPPPLSSSCLTVDSKHADRNTWQMWIEWEVYRCIPRTHPHLFFENIFADENGKLTILSHDSYFLLNTTKQDEYLNGGTCRSLHPGDSVGSSLFRAASSGGSGGSGGSGSSGGSGGSGGSSGSGRQAAGTEHAPSAKVPNVSQFSDGPMIVTPGKEAVLTGYRLNCTTEVRVNDVSTAFSTATLADGKQQLTIAVPPSLGPGRHSLTMDSCGGSVFYSNVLFVPRPSVQFEAVTRNAIDRGLQLVALRAFVNQNRDHYNTIHCIVNVSEPRLRALAKQMLDNYCNTAYSLLALPASITSEQRVTHKPTNIWVRVILSNK